MSVKAESAKQRGGPLNRYRQWAIGITNPEESARPSGVKSFLLHYANPLRARCASQQARSPTDPVIKIKNFVRLLFSTTVGVIPRHPGRVAAAATGRAPDSLRALHG